MAYIPTWPDPTNLDRDPVSMPFDLVHDPDDSDTRVVQQVLLYDVSNCSGTMSGLIKLKKSAAYTNGQISVYVRPHVDSQPVPNGHYRELGRWLATFVDLNEYNNEGRDFIGVNNDDDMKNAGVLPDFAVFKELTTDRLVIGNTNFRNYYLYPVRPDYPFAIPLGREGGNFDGISFLVESRFPDGADILDVTISVSLRLAYGKLT
ncbi:MAG: hypothetical protein MAG453_01607 [Calditrichaeota bacterium]|nr:hypothetical protein [Calditrichota bacterium]